MRPPRSIRLWWLLIPCVFIEAAASRAVDSSANPMHPIFAPLDAHGAPAFLSRMPSSSEKTCGGCHDAQYINTHNGHWTSQVKVECVACHIAEGRFPSDPSAYDGAGRLRREAIRISAPTADHCASCHGIVHTGDDPLRIPADFGPGRPEGRSYGLTLRTGEILAGQNLSESFLNLRSKVERAYPWDIHARRLVTCVSCHYAANNPVKADPKRDRIEFLVDDPRKISLADYLFRPDHRLATAGCRSCHDPLETHDFLPYKRRHLDALACQACHMPEVFGPAARMIDSTVTTLDGRPRFFIRNAGGDGAAPLNTLFLSGYTPLLLPVSEVDGVSRLAPFNATDRWSWREGATGRPVPWDTVRQAFLSRGGYAPEIVAALDRDGNGSLEPGELALDTEEKSATVGRRLEALGVANPVISRAIEVNPLRHGVLSGKQVSRDCEICHADDSSRLRSGLALSHYLPGGRARTEPPGSGAAPREARLGMTEHGTRIDPPSSGRLHVFGHSRGGWTDRLGFSLFLATVLAATLHASVRYATRRSRLHRPRPGEEVYLYTLYERIWHWMMAGSVLILIATGFQIHFAGPGAWLSLPRAVAVHNLFAVVLVVNGFLSLFYHVTTRTIRHFLPRPDGFLAHALDQARFYTSGIFMGRPHPSPRTVERRLNPLQQVTYLFLLNILFPLQALTGVLIWGAPRWPEIIQGIGGLALIAPLHNLGAWLFLSFLALHIYLTTTGHSVLAHVRAMVRGYDLVEPVPAPARRSSHDPFQE